MRPRELQSYRRHRAGLPRVVNSLPGSGSHPVGGRFGAHADCRQQPRGGVRVEPQRRDDEAERRTVQARREISRAPARGVLVARQNIPRLQAPRHDEQRQNRSFIRHDDVAAHSNAIATQKVGVGCSVLRRFQLSGYGQQRPVIAIVEFENGCTGEAV